MNRLEVISLIKQFSGQANILTIPRAFIHYTGSIDCALFLSQILYWSDKTKSKDGWFYKKYEDWQNELGLSEYQVRKACKTLKDRGVLDTRVKKANGTPTLHYLLLENNFSDSIVEFLKNQIRTNLTDLDPEESKDSINIDYQTSQTAFCNDLGTTPFCGQEFLAALADYEQHCKELKRGLKPTSRKALYKKLLALSEEDATLALTQAIEHRWSNIFPRQTQKLEDCSPRRDEHPNSYRPGKMVV